MNKLIALLLALCLVTMAIPAFADDDITGDWYGIMYGAALTLSLNEDGTYTLGSDTQIATEGTWELKDNKLIMDGDDIEEDVFLYDGSSLANEVHGVTFTRESVSADLIEIAEPKADAAEEDFIGEWTCTYIETQGILMDLASNLQNIGLEEAPSMKIEDGTVTFIHLSDLFGGSRYEKPVQYEFTDGALNQAFFSSTRFTITMLQDGMIVLDLSHDLGENAPFLYFVPAAAEEEPAV